MNINLKIKRLDFLSIILISVIIFQINICPLSNLQTEKKSNSNEDTELQTFFSYPSEDISNSTHLMASKILANSVSTSEDNVESYNMGSTKTFWVENLKYANDGIDNDGNGIDFQQGDWAEAMYQITAVVVNITNFAYIFVEQDCRNHLESYYKGKLASDIGQVFETKIEPMISQFGSPSDIDHNGKIIILIFPFIESSSSTFMTGYFFSNNMQKPLSDKTNFQYYSNHGEIININDEVFKTLGNAIDNWGPTLTHEYFHLVHYNYNPTEDLWLEEGFAVFAEYFTGFKSGYRSYLQDNNDGYFLHASDTSLTYFQQTLENYGQSFLFVLYLYQRFGLNFIKSLMQTKLSGMTAIKNQIGLLHDNITFEDVYSDWMISNVVNDQTNSIYSYNNFSYKLSSNQFSKNNNINIPSEIKDQIVPYWSNNFIILPQNDLQPYYVTFYPELQTHDSEFQLSVVTFHSNGHWDFVKIPLVNDESGSFLIQYASLSDSKILIVSSLTGGSSGSQTIEKNLLENHYYNVYNLNYDVFTYSLKFGLKIINDTLPTYFFTINTESGESVSNTQVKNISISIYDWNTN